MGQPFPGNWNFAHHPWLLEMHDSEAPNNVGQKAAQLGYTEWALNKALFSMDVLGLSVLYILPSDGDASDFSAARFDKALENSAYLNDFFSNVKNVGHKRAGNASLYVRGSRSRSKLKSIDTAVIVYDELDEMDQAAISLASERQSGQVIQHSIKISTPTIEDFGINKEFKLSTQENFFFKCPGCSRLIELLFPESVVITADSRSDPRVKDTHYICHQCKVKLPHETKTEWLKPVKLGGTARFVPMYSDRDIRGFFVPQMYSTTVTPEKFALSYIGGLVDPTEETEFYNSKLGKPHAVAGAKLNEEQINSTIKGYNKGPVYGKVVTMGIDVGSVNHVSIEEWTLPSYRTPGLDLNDECSVRVLYEGTTSGKSNDFDELGKLMGEYGVRFAVIDAEPERRLSYQFATKFWGRVYLCDFLWSQTGRSILVGPEEERTVKVNRTSWFDLALGRFRTGSIALPNDVSYDYKRHMREPQRVYKKDKYGNPFGYYESIGADHFALTRVYNEIALIFAVNTNATQDIV